MLVHKIAYITVLVECGRNTATGTGDFIDPNLDIGVRVSVHPVAGEVVGGRGSWPWLASLGRYLGLMLRTFVLFCTLQIAAVCQ